MKIFYARVSTVEQNEARQLAKAKEMGAEKVYLDKLSGKDMNREQLVDMLAFIRSGDVVMVESFSRLARNTKDLLEIVEKIRSKGAELISEKESVDTSTPQGKFMLTVFGAMAELERENILQRQGEGIEIRKAEDAARKAQGLKPIWYKGRQRIEPDTDKMKTVCKAWRAGEITAREAMKRVELEPNTFYRRVKEMGL